MHNWTYTPLPVNVYTIMFSYYVDWGYWGIIIFSILLGAFWGGIWKGIKKGYKVVHETYEDNSKAFEHRDIALPVILYTEHLEK